MRAQLFWISFPVDFKLSRFRIITSHHLVMAATDDDLRGVGSGVLYRSTGAAVARAWKGWLHEEMASLDVDHLEKVWPSLVTRTLAVDPGLAYALDSAIWDLLGQRSGHSVSEYLGGRQRDSVVITEQIFIDDWHTSRDELRRILDRGTTSLKIKIGFSFQEDLRLLRRVCDYVGGETELRVDANRAYSYADAVDFYRRVAELGILAFEEPIHFRDMEELARLRDDVGVPVMLDESILTADDLKQAIKAEAIDGLNIKLSRVGGLSQGREYRRLCDRAGVAVSIGCSEDLGPGMASILHLGASTERLHSTEGIGHMRLGADVIWEAMSIEDGRVAVPSGPGLGVTLHPEFPDHIHGRARVLDHSTAPGWLVRAISNTYRGRQRAANAWYRLGRALKG